MDVLSIVLSLVALSLGLYALVLLAQLRRLARVQRHLERLAKLHDSK